MAEETVSEEYVYEYWDCPKCGNKGIRGDLYKCNQCGFPRDNSITFYRKEESEETVSETNEVEKFKKGPDWICSFCESLNSQEDENCKGCGATKSDSEKNYFEELKKREAKAQKSSPPISEEPKSPKKSKGLILGGLILSAVIGFFSYGSCTHKVDYTVKKAEWVRALAQERYMTRERVDWRDEMKGDDPEVIRTENAIRRYEKRQVGTRTESYTENERFQSGTKNECNTTYESTGSGASKKVKRCKDVPVYDTRPVTKTREVPVFQDFPIYDTKVTYRSGLYETIGYRIKRGKDNDPIWPELSAGIGEKNKEDRKGKTEESLTVIIEKVNSGDKGPDSEKLSLQEIDFKENFKLNSKITLEVNNFGSISYKGSQKTFDEKAYKEIFEPIFRSELK
ncbi:MAG: hypothetical protein H7A24_00690 [Leptospiraceae bacterium]|nr:hypothetical protein [Leptospiraceae bacterium]MCP5510370.1 hypothetical protein [Leptospiraceae bacterium]